MKNLANGLVSGPRNLLPDAFEARFHRVAGGLKALGVTAGDCVAILMRNDIPFLEANFAAQMLGAYAVPINWHGKGDEIGYILADCGARVLFAHADLLQAARPPIPPGTTVIAVAPPADMMAAYGTSCDATDWPGLHYEHWLAAQSPNTDPPRPAPQSMIYTSGTTGYPKGVRRLAPTPEQEAYITQFRRLVYGIEPGIRGMVPGPLYHSAPNAFAMRAARIAEALFLVPKFDPEAFLKLVDAQKITTVFMVPTMFIRLLRLPLAVRQLYDVSSLKFIIHAAAPCPADVKRAMIDWWGPIIHEFYGATESGPVTIATSEDALKKPGTVGRVTPGGRLAIVDEKGQDVPQGTVGEIYSRLDGYPDFTYHNRPEKRAEIDRNGYVTCGDMGYLDEDGYLFVCDRKRDMVIMGGTNIYPAEIEGVIQSLPGVHDCAVFGIPDADLGEVLMAVVEPQPGMTLVPEALRSALLERMASYKVPRHIEIRTGLPREDSGKIFKRRLRDPFWEIAGRVI